MQAFFPFLIVPLILVIVIGVGQWWSGRILPQPENISVPRMTQLPPNARELRQQIGEEQVPPLRLASLMPAEVIDRMTPLPPPPDRRLAAERFRLSSVLLGEGMPSSAVIDDRVVREGERFDDYRLLRVATDHVWVSGPHGRERIDIASSIPAPVVAPARQASTTGAALPPPPDAATLERQFRRLLENLGQ